MAKRCFTQNARKNALKKAGNICSICKSPLSLNKSQAHHIEPLSKGGKTIITNLQVLCKKCHSTLHKNQSQKTKTNTTKSPPKSNVKKNTVAKKTNPVNKKNTKRKTRPSPKKTTKNRRFTREMKSLGLQKARNKCCKCSKPLTMATAQTHYIKPLSKGGKTIMANLQILCNRCHTNLHRKLIRDKKQATKKKVMLSKENRQPNTKKQAQLSLINKN